MRARIMEGPHQGQWVILPDERDHVPLLDEETGKMVTYMIRGRTNSPSGSVVGVAFMKRAG